MFGIFENVRLAICRIRLALAAIMGRRPPLDCWLRVNSDVADSIKWQPRFEATTHVVPESAKDKWADWSAAEQQELIEAYGGMWAWLHRVTDPFENLNETMPYPPENLAGQISDDRKLPFTMVSEDYARRLYIQWVALNLTVEIAGLVPWSIRDYDAAQRQVLLDSAAIMSRSPNDVFLVGTGHVMQRELVERKHNLGRSLIAPPRYTYAFLWRSGIIGATKRETIESLLQWLRENAEHFAGHANYGNMETHWQYRGLPPITRIIEGTTHTGIGKFSHWTAGCHGTSGFLRNVLRAANIPVEIARICTHNQPHFMTEGLYLDHADNVYDTRFKPSNFTVGELLIDEQTFTNWFGPERDNHEENCDGVGRQLDVLFGN